MGYLSQLSDQFFTISLPRDVVISNRRLGLLRRLLELAMVCWIILTLVRDRACMQRYEPTSHGSSLWVEDGDGQLLQNGSVMHCQEPAEYDYVWSEEFTYRPRRCQSLPPGEMFHRDVGYVGLPTYMQETSTWAASGPACTASARTACEDNPGGTWLSANDHCECQVHDEFLVKNTDVQRLVLTHGYEVRSSDGETLRTGNSKMDVLTIVLDRDGNPCPVGAPDGGGSGKSHWTPEESFTGIWGSAREWLACAGSSLDTRSPYNARMQEDDQPAPYLRITGLMLDFDLDFQNEDQHSEDYDGVVCYIRVDAIPAWVAKNAVFPISSDMVLQVSLTRAQARFVKASRLRYGYYLSARLKLRGTFAYFSSAQLLYAITSSTVLMSLPAMFVYWFALYGVGMLSRIYYKATVEFFNVRKLMPDVGAQLVAACSSFSAVAGTGPGAVLRKEDIMTCVSAIFSNLLREDTTKKRYKKDDDSEDTMVTREVALVSQVFLDSMDRNTSGDVDLEEFVTAYMESGRMGIMDLVEFFDTNRRAGCLERLFSSASTRTLREGASPAHGSATPGGSAQDVVPWPNARQTVPVTSDDPP